MNKYMHKRTKKIQSCPSEPFIRCADGLPGPPEQQEGQGQQSSTQQVTQGAEVGDAVAGRVLPPLPEPGHHPVGHTQQWIHLRGVRGRRRRRGYVEDNRKQSDVDVCCEYREFPGPREQDRLTWMRATTRKMNRKNGVGTVWAPSIRWMAYKKISWPGMTNRNSTLADRWFAPGV